MKYEITKYTHDKAKRLALKVYPSTNKKHKLDVYDLEGNFIASVGAIGYLDYPSYKLLEQQGKYPKGYADERRRLYKLRHKGDINHYRGYLANELLW
jgi:hypothetical protein